MYASRTSSRTGEVAVDELVLAGALAALGRLRRQVEWTASHWWTRLSSAVHRFQAGWLEACVCSYILTNTQLSLSLVMEEPGFQDDTLQSAENLPWYRGPADARPYILSKLLNSTQPTSPPFHCTATFPWSASSMSVLWDGCVTDEDLLADWKQTVDDYAGTVAIGSTGSFYVFPKLTTAKPFCLRLPDETWEVRCAAWALNPRHPANPLIVFAPFSVIFILDVKTRRIIGRLRGHGGPITSIAVHPTHPYLFCTTSRDFTSRIYDLTYAPVQRPNNPPWPPSKQPSLAGPAFGLQMTESEGDGIGQCVAVLVGGRSGGHRGAVFCAAFHRTEPLIATGGMDRAVKIWRIPPLEDGRLAREDKPLFSTDYIHKARVLSISWLSDDILISHSASAPMRRSERVDDLYIENGTVQIWQWLGFNRFFPPDRGDKPIPKVMRGCASDYRNSESFKVLSAYHLPLTTLHATVYTSPTNTHDPLLLVPVGKTIRAFNITHFRARPPPPFPLAEDEVVALTKRMRLGSGEEGVAGEGGEQAGPSGSSGLAPGREREDGEDAGAQGEDEEDGAGDDGQQQNVQEDIPWDHHREGYMLPLPSRLEELFTAIEGWDVDLSSVEAGKRAVLPDIATCEVISGGRVILGTGERGTLYIWRLAGPGPA
ncbi:WD40 repeat-like protein [Daedalea quercina L-15889]|uniref:WD40 repeat-like protein n=1 Tax=Daedalea quercina L-15889 TaxID=1314783 RepID=A0A165T299_9APHY|nr:WD40 repeat-like protein [Daedalea quercina L-15889]